jgi:hypothetical protein
MDQKLTIRQPSNIQNGRSITICLVRIVVGVGEKRLAVTTSCGHRVVGSIALRVRVRIGPIGRSNFTLADRTHFSVLGQPLIHAFCVIN